MLYGRWYVDGRKSAPPLSLRPLTPSATVLFLPPRGVRLPRTTRTPTLKSEESEALQFLFFFGRFFFRNAVIPKVVGRYPPPGEPLFEIFFLLLE